MNRIILIGNGFDLAHGLKTSYADFINKFWKVQKDNANSFGDWKGENGSFVYENDFFKLKTIKYNKYQDIATLKQDISYYKNNFLERIEKVRVINNWVDLEELYYRELLKCLKIEKDNDDTFLVSSIKKLNEDFDCIRKEFENYLSENIKNEIDKDKKLDEIYQHIWNENDDFSGKVLFLNFNYTDTEKLYTKKIEENEDIDAAIDEERNIVIHIHGVVNNPDNPMIFGYGDELAVDFKDIENTNRNEFLENAKSIKYLETSNYDELLDFLKEEYEVFIFGHSCGNSDRTLLNTIFENPKLEKIIPFYYKESENKDNYSEIVKNISRSFTKESNSKSNLRKHVEKHKSCKPLYYENKIEVDLKEFLEKEFVKIDGAREYALIEKNDKKHEINSFYIGKHQVTQEKYIQIMDCKNQSNFKGENLPVERVTWYDCAEFCDKLSKKYKLSTFYNLSNIIKGDNGEIRKADILINHTAKGFRLPSENEWEYAATSEGKFQKNDKELYSRNERTNDIIDLGWFLENSEKSTHPVGQKKPNDLGIYDMSGNVWEWCEDWYDDSGINRVNRGGSWGDNARSARVSYRNVSTPGYRNGNLGFRLACSL